MSRIGLEAWCLLGLVCLWGFLFDFGVFVFVLRFFGFFKGCICSAETEKRSRSAPLFQVNNSSPTHLKTLLGVNNQLNNQKHGWKFPPIKYTPSLNVFSESNCP